MQESLISDGKIKNQSPVDLHPLAPVQVSTQNDIHRLVSKAREAQPVWEEIGFEARARILKAAGKAMLERRQEVLELIHDEVGKTPGELLMSEAVGPLQYISDWVKVARPWLKPRKLSIPFLAFPRKEGQIEMLPRGVIGVIAPWNYPLANFFKPVFAALLCGNSVVIKPSEYSPRTAEWFVKIMGEYLPQGVLSLAQGDKEVGQALVRAGIDAVTFTGSFSSGREVARLAAEQMIPISVELGGKDAAIVLEDCDLDRTVAGVMHWALHNAGQACGDIERVYLVGSIADRFVEKLVAAVRKLRVHSGDPQFSDVGPSAHLAQLRIVEAQVSEALAEGAQLLCGGKRASKGLWYEPTVLDYCNNSMKVMQEPTFGPVIPIVRVSDPEEAVRLANDCQYGLNASVWSGDIRRATQLARKLQVGTAFVNNHAFTGAMPAAPWTGVKKSGHGIANSTFALQHYTRPRTLVIDRKKTADGWWLPMNSDAEDLGHRLAEAQLGNIVAALKIPFLMARRQRAVIKFVRQKGSSEGSAPFESRDLTSIREVEMSISPLFSSLSRVGVVLTRWVRKCLPPLSSLEIKWAKLAMDVIFLDSASPPRLKPFTQEQGECFLRDIYQAMPFPANLSMRFTYWVIGLSPLFFLLKLKTLDRLSRDEQVKVIQRLDESRFYWFRQLSILLKMNGALSYAGTTRFSVALKELDQQKRATPAKTPQDDFASKPHSSNQPLMVGARQDMEI